MADRIETGWLFDFYGPLLTERQRDMLSLYCEEDFSLSEIAAQEGISRQGVYDAVHRAQRQLEEYERQLEDDAGASSGAQRAFRRAGRSGGAGAGHSHAAAFRRGGIGWPLRD